MYLVYRHLDVVCIGVNAAVRPQPQRWLHVEPPGVLCGDQHAHQVCHASCRTTAGSAAAAAGCQCSRHRLQRIRSTETFQVPDSDGPQGKRCRAAPNQVLPASAPPPCASGASGNKGPGPGPGGGLLADVASHDATGRRPPRLSRPSKAPSRSTWASAPPSCCVPI